MNGFDHLVKNVHLHINQQCDPDYSTAVQ